MLQQIYRHSLSLLTDLYQLTMAYGYWKSGMAARESVFHLFFRKNPFAGGYAVACGLETALEYLEQFRFDDDDVAYLATLTGSDGQPLFEQAFLDYLRALELDVSIDAMPEGTLAFAHEPLLRVRGPILHCQLIETPLLNIVNFQTLIATKAARICGAAAGEPVLEFGLRRAQGIDGALAASRAAYVGGCTATSNVLAGKLYDIPVKGTHAHSWVMLFDSELEAFAAYADAMPNNCVFLVDTFDTLDGVRNAIQIGRKLRDLGHELAGIRLDSGDLAYLSIEARKVLDDAGFKATAIVASNDLDEHIITSLKQQGATIAVWGVGTKLATASDQPALGGVYKLAAVRKEPSSDWTPKLKLSEQAIKISIPGLLQVRRHYRRGVCVGDSIFDSEAGHSDDQPLFDIGDPNRRWKIPEHSESRDLLVPVFSGNRATRQRLPLDAIRDNARKNLDALSPRSRRLLNPHQYWVGLDSAVHQRRQRLIAEARGDKLP